MEIILYFTSVLFLFGLISGHTKGTSAQDNNGSDDSVEKYKSCENQKLCVPRHLCKSGEIVTDGAGLIDSYSISTDATPKKKTQTSPAEGTQCGPLEECCHFPYATSGCGLRNPSGIGFRIVDGKNDEAEYGEFPWMVAVLSIDTGPELAFDLHECGGTLISPTVVITAAECVQNRLANTLILRAGDWDTQTMYEIYFHQDRPVQDIILHEKFNKNTLFNNIALLIVGIPFEFTEIVYPICLPPPNTNFDLSSCYITGWGKNKLGKEGKYTPILKKIAVPIVPRDKCQQNLRKTRLGKLFNLHESFICAGGELGKGSCKGDGGFPLVCPIAGTKDHFYHAGIVAWGIGCAEENIPGVYANVAHLRPWINEKLSKLGIDFRHFTP